MNKSEKEKKINYIMENIKNISKTVSIKIGLLIEKKSNSAFLTPKLKVEKNYIDVNLSSLSDEVILEIYDLIYNYIKTIS